MQGSKDRCVDVLSFHVLCFGGEEVTLFQTLFQTLHGLSLTFTQLNEITQRLCMLWLVFR